MKTTRFKTERDFGLIVGGIFAILGGWWRYRGMFGATATVFIGLGAALLLFGLVFPRALVLPNRAWMAFASVISGISTGLFLSMIFYLILTPVGFIKRRMGWDPLMRRRAPGASYWSDYAERDTRHYEELF